MCIYVYIYIYIYTYATGVAADLAKPPRRRASSDACQYVPFLVQ